MAECLLAERRHRYNHKVSEHKRWDFPMLGHFDTWLIDVMQRLVEQNHNVHYLPNWTNTGDYADTPETFGTVPIHSAELGAALEGLVIPPEASAKFSSEQRFLCKRMGTRAPMLPVHGEAECRKFDEMLRGGNSDQNWDKMAVDWCQHVDGVTIFPKLPVYLRTHHTAWVRNQRVKEAVRKAAPGEAVLARLNEKTRQELLPEPARPSPTVAVAVGAATAAAPPAGPSVAGGGASSFKGVREDPAGSSAMPWCASIRVDGVQVDLGRFASEAAAALAYDFRARHLGRPLNFPLGNFLSFAQHAPMPAAVHPVEGDDVLMVGGVNVGGQLPVDTKRTRGQRGGDTKPREQRSCRACKDAARPGALSCQGRSGRGKCPYSAGS